ncbi:MAG TPA: potassium channel protein [Desulfobacteraceae bacterium]|nr:potassium channel protein [Deltaproteobacteria bacterium]MBW2356398.1 potassium channel protein [Deltaproteobacteria bacterium]RLB95319.1 MAG: potassium channel protein [Deltaproteobacteria bacterium]HDI61115.1 potassium channel protein [Desulfobacteraceae bacterium]
METRRLKISLCLLAAIVAFGTLGYHIVEGMAFFDAFYMTLITISTVGFSEVKPLSPAGRAVTVVIIVMGISTLTYSLGQVLRIFVEGELLRILGRRKLENRIQALKGHYIVCGYGRIGEVISRELGRDKMPFVVVEQDAAKVSQMEKAGLLYLEMDATSEEALIRAGIERARGLVTAVTSDADNVFITLTARGLRNDLFILSRASDQKNEDKLLRAGATRVVCPYQIGGRRMAQQLTRPTVIDFIDTAMVERGMGLRMEEEVIGADSPLAGRSLVESRLRQEYGVIVVAIKPRRGEMIFNPLPTQKLAAGDVIVLLGKQEELDRLHEVI